MKMQDSLVLGLFHRWAVFFCATPCLVGLLGTPALAQHSVGNGGGYAEEQVLFALQTFGRASDLCRDARVILCELNQAQKAALVGIRALLPIVTAPQQVFAFRAESEDPIRFPQGQRVKFATEKNPGSPILVNRTLLYRPTGSGLFVPVDLMEAYGLVAQILAYQSGDLPDDDAYELGQEVGAMIGMRANELEMGLSTDDVPILDPKKRIRWLAVGLEGPDQGLQFAKVFLQDSEAMRDLTPLLASRFGCAESGVAQFSFGRMTPKMSYASSRLQVQLTGQARYVCPNDPVLINSAQAVIELEFSELVVSQPMGDRDRAFRFKPDSLKLQLKSPQ